MGRGYLGPENWGRCLGWKGEGSGVAGELVVTKFVKRLKVRRFNLHVAVFEPHAAGSRARGIA